MLALIPVVAISPILLYIGMLIGAQAFQDHAHDARAGHRPGAAAAPRRLGASRMIDGSLGAAGVHGDARDRSSSMAMRGVLYHGLEVLGGGSILAGLVLAAIAVFMIDRAFVKAAGFALAGAVLTFFGLMHGERLGINVTPSVALAYLMVAGFLLAVARLGGSAACPSAADLGAPWPTPAEHLDIDALDAASGMAAPPTSGPASRTSSPSPRKWRRPSTPWSFPMTTSPSPLSFGARPLSLIHLRERHRDRGGGRLRGDQRGGDGRGHARPDRGHRSRGQRLHRRDRRARAGRRPQRIDAARAAGRPLGPLAGVPFAAKNLFDIAGLPTRAGSRINRERAPAARDGLLVARMRTAGAILVGGLNMGEYAYDFTGENAHDGPCRNPHDPARMSGGSSSGCGGATARGWRRSRSARTPTDRSGCPPRSAACSA